MTDENIWLEDVEGEEALAWVRAQNKRSLTRLEAHPRFSGFLTSATNILTTEDRIPYAAIRGGHGYNFWQDDKHVKGIWRRAPIDSYLANSPEWETLLDVDQLAADEGENWVFGGANPLWVDDVPDGRYLISLSDGGKDAQTVREYDAETRSFVDNGFVSPAAKQAVRWLTPDETLIATGWGDDTTTESGYPRTVRRWRRGTNLADAELLHTGEHTDVGNWPITLRRSDGTEIYGAIRRTTFFTGTYFLASPTSSELRAVPLPPKADIEGLFQDQAVCHLQQDWTLEDGTNFASGDLVAFDIDQFLTTGALGPVTLVFRPSERQAVQQFDVSQGRALLSYSDNVVSKLGWIDRTSDGVWQLSPIDLPGQGEGSIKFASPRERTILVDYQDFLTPPSLFALDPRRESPDLVRSGASHFDTDGLTVVQRSVEAPDGVVVPYFVVHKQDSKLTGETPTLLYGYGGFEISMTPSYGATTGKLWLEEGGAYVLANIRGGGEFGPAWHQAALKQNRQTAYDDFIAVAEDLIYSGFTSPRRLGIMGGSNGGLLMGVMLTQRPDLWNAVVIQVPLLDMLRYHLLLAGASWVDEYGSPDNHEERAFLEEISPYHQFDPSATYPEPFFVTSTKDDRVHPGHARKMAKRFADADFPFLYFENIDGGHGAATTQLERAKRVAVEFTYLTDKLMG